MEDASPNSTTFPASRRRVQWSCPSGAGLQAKACPRPRPGGDQVGLAPVVQLPGPVGLGTVLQNLLQPFFGKALLDPVYRAQGHIQSFGHLGRGPTVAAL